MINLANLRRLSLRPRTGSSGGQGDFPIGCIQKKANEKSGQIQINMPKKKFSQIQKN